MRRLLSLKLRYLVEYEGFIIISREVLDNIEDRVLLQNINHLNPKNKQLLRSSINFKDLEKYLDAKFQRYKSESN
jgi:hypothetical protein